MKSLDSLLKGMAIVDVTGDTGTFVEGLAYDSRKVAQGDLFVAVRGTRQDGGRFIRDALERGARVIVAESAPHDGLPVPFVRVADSRKALATLSANYFGHPARELEIIGVTGTNGKTTTTLLLEGILKQEGHSVGVIGTLAYRWAGKQLSAAMTTPESFDLQKLFRQMRDDGVTHVVMEVSSHALSLGRIDGCLFKAGAFTNLSQDHLDYHSTMEEYFSAKAMLFRGCLGMNGSSSLAVINQDDSYGRRLIAEGGASTWSYSTGEASARVSVKEADLTPSGIRTVLSTPRGEIEIRSSLMGRLNLYNILCAATTALALGISPRAIREGLRAVSFVDGRLQRVPVPAGLGFEVVVDYAHTPDAMEKSLGCLREMTGRRLLAVFGCGGDRDRGKRPLMGEVASRICDLVIVTSDNPRSEVPESIIGDIEPGIRDSGLPLLAPDPSACPARGYTLEVDRKVAIELALAWAGPGDIVFIGGKGHETYQIIGGKVIDFDDRKVVSNYLEVMRTTE